MGDIGGTTLLVGGAVGLLLVGVALHMNIPMVGTRREGEEVAINSCQNK